MTVEALVAGLAIDPVAGAIAGGVASERRLSQLVDAFADPAEAARLAASVDPVVYRVSTIEGPDEAGALSIGVGWLAPGRVGDEYFLTRGHLHSWRAAAEVYLGLAGEGVLLLEGEAGDSAVRLAAGEAVYVPGATAHRTVNTGSAPLVYVGIYPALAGHDYESIRERNFHQIVVAGPRGPVVRRRADPAPGGHG